MSTGKTSAASEAARALGSIRTARKAAASARNGVATRFQPKPLVSIPCTCTGGNSIVRADHRGNCPRYRAIWYREKHGLPIE